MVKHPNPPTYTSELNLSESLSVDTARRMAYQQLSNVKQLSENEARAECALLLEHTLQKSDTWQRTYPDYELSRDELTQLKSALIKRIDQHQPIQYITGKANFMGRWFNVTPDVLIPREDTSHLVKGAIKRAQAIAKTNSRPVNIMDLGTGSGCIAITLALELTQLGIPFHIIAIDISEAALDIAQRNAQLYNISNHLRFVQGDIMAFGSTDLAQQHLLVSNPPYIDEATYQSLMDEVRHHEPKLALVAESNGLEFYKKLAELTPQNSWLLAEFGFNNTGSQQQAIANILPNWQQVTFFTDDANIPRWFEGAKTT